MGRTFQRPHSHRRIAALLDAACAQANNAGQRERMTTTTSIELLIESVRAWAGAAKRIVVLTGAT